MFYETYMRNLTIVNYNTNWQTDFATSFFKIEKSTRGLVRLFYDR